MLTSAKTEGEGEGGSTTMKGTLNSTPGKTFAVQFSFSLKGIDEGKKFVGETGVTSDGSGNASFTLVAPQALPAGENITATATDSVGNTSEFSAPRAVVADTTAPG